MTPLPGPAASVSRGQARSRARRIGQQGVSLEERQQRLNPWLLACGHRAGEVRDGHDPKDCRAELDDRLDQILPGKGA